MAIPSLARSRPATPGRGGLVLDWARHQPAACVAAVWIAIIVLACVFGPFFLVSPNQIDPTSIFAPPALGHLLGTDELGRDLLSRLLNGGRLSLVAAAGSTSLAMILGLAWAFAAAEFGGWIDEVLMRLADLLMAIPLILFALACVAAFGPGLGEVILITGVLMSPLTARVMRAEAHRQRQQPYAMALVAMGIPKLRLWMREIFPNTEAVFVAQTLINLATSLMVEASLSYLGFGVEPPAASWGTLLQDGYSHLYNAVWYPLAPAIAIVTTIAAFNVLGSRLAQRGTR